MNILTYQLEAPTNARGPWRELGSFTRFLPKCPFTGHVERALWGGFHADRLGYAFVAGYGAALARLVEHATRLQMNATGPREARDLSSSRPPSSRPLPARLCLAATESGGGHPRAIATRVEKQGGALVLNGEKTFVTLATASDEMLVVASRGLEQGGKNRLRIVRVKPDARGVTIEERPPTPFAPEIPHAIVRFHDVVVETDDVLAGDGYDNYLKPFRTIEDTHVLAATVGYLTGVARAYDFSRDIVAELLSLSLAIIDVAAREAGSPLTHVILAGLFGSVKRLAGNLAPEWAKAPAEERERWERDLGLLLVAEGVRTKRTDKAFATFRTSS